MKFLPSDCGLLVPRTSGCNHTVHPHHNDVLQSYNFFRVIFMSDFNTANNDLQRNLFAVMWHKTIYMLEKGSVFK